MTRRNISSLIVLISILVLPYWLYIPILFIAIIFFSFYWEGILFAFLVDVLYGDGVSFYSISPLVLGALAAIVILMPFRARLRSYV